MARYRSSVTLTVAFDADSVEEAHKRLDQDPTRG